MKQKRQKLIRGKVRHGDKRGRTLGYPTANVRLHRSLQEGVYLSFTRVKSVWYPSLTFIGAPKTFHRTGYKAESHILDFTSMIYGRWISIRLVKRIRGNKRFRSIESLVLAMNKDERIARHYFSGAKEYNR